MVRPVKSKSASLTHHLKKWMRWGSETRDASGHGEASGRQGAARQQQQQKKQQKKQQQSQQTRSSGRNVASTDAHKEYYAEDAFSSPISTWTPRHMPPHYATVKDLPYYATTVQGMGHYASNQHVRSRPPIPRATIPTPSSARLPQTNRTRRIDSLYAPQLPQIHHISSFDQLPKYQRQTIGHVSSTLGDYTRTWPRQSAPPAAHYDDNDDDDDSDDFDVFQPTHRPFFNHERRSISSYASSDLPLDHVLHQWSSYMDDDDEMDHSDDDSIIMRPSMHAKKVVKKKRSLAPIVNPEVDAHALKAASMRATTSSSNHTPLLQLQQQWQAHQQQQHVASFAVTLSDPPVRASIADDEPLVRSTTKCSPNTMHRLSRRQQSAFQKPLPPRPPFDGVLSPSFSLPTRSDTLPAPGSSSMTLASTTSTNTGEEDVRPASKMDSDALLRQFYATPIKHSTFDLDTMLLLAHGEQYLSERENTHWSSDDDDAHVPYAFHRWPSKSTPILTSAYTSSSTSTSTIVPASASTSTLAASPATQRYTSKPNHGKRNSQDVWVNEVYEEFHRIVNTYVVF